MSYTNKVNLLQMQRYFEGQVDKIRVISDLKLSENEYRSLGVRLKSLSFFDGSEKDIEEYMLSILVYCTYSLIYGDIGTSFEDVFSKCSSSSAPFPPDSFIITKTIRATAIIRSIRIAISMFYRSFRVGLVLLL